MKPRLLKWNEAIANCRTTIGYRIFDYPFISDEAKKLINPFLIGKGYCDRVSFGIKNWRDSNFQINFVVSFDCFTFVKTKAKWMTLSFF